MERPLTVDELIEKLREYSESGYGGAFVITAPAGSAVESTHGPVREADAFALRHAAQAVGEFVVSADHGGLRGLRGRRWVTA